MAPVRLAVLGMGLIGRRHLALAANEPACTVVAAADPQGAARADVEAAGARFYPDYRELLERETLDGVIVATPNSTHAPLGIACVRRGLPILVEKPLTDTVEAGRRLLEAAAAAGVAVAVGHHRRFDPSVEVAKLLIDEGQLGTLSALHVLWAMRKHPTYFDAAWRRVRPGGGPVLINLIHDIDLMRHFGGEVIRVYAELSCGQRGFEVEDLVAATLRFASGAVGSIVTSDVTPSPWGWELGSGENPDLPGSGRNCYRILGTDAALALPRLELWRHADADGSWRTPIQMLAPPLGPREALARQLAHFCAVVRGEVTPRISGADGLATLAATVAVIQSGEAVQPVAPEMRL